MKVQIRQGVFETNSSSVHSLTMVSGEEFTAWKEGKLLFNRDEDEFVPFSEELADEEDYQTFDQFFDNEVFEVFEDSFTTKSGEEVVAFGYHGNDN